MTKKKNKSTFSWQITALEAMATDNLPLLPTACRAHRRCGSRKPLGPHRPPGLGPQQAQRSRPRPTLKAPKEAARGQAPRVRYSPQHPQPGIAALRGAGCGIFASAAARVEPQGTGLATCGARRRGSCGCAPAPAPAPAPPRPEDDVTDRGQASRGPRQSELCFPGPWRKSTVSEVYGCSGQKCR
ncbi:large proline-rich protein BAG6-like [Mesocricetus auratus]|uniref:Large proline-rich protein BAG6-like n=1 Tax=Mesocricetus auratus TaxID=10036 RepID=A0ABM2WWZ7_MESAU|nr:large proline-rich protein BAG6-like [Mesocricetus auratus]XP_040595226.1 large proline-rich protein BAG6-like [Mesocricetus auratus]XP_040595227.1 large proline-rich protein BAG6-like [Mesocricetus auratus]